MSIWFVLIPIVVLTHLFIQVAPASKKAQGLAPLFIGLASSAGIILYTWGGLAFSAWQGGYREIAMILFFLDAFAVLFIVAMLHIAWVCVE